MDFSKLNTADKLKAGGGILFFLAYLFPWWGASVSVGGVTYGGSWSGSHYFFTGTFPMLLLLAVAVVTILKMTATKLPALPWPTVFILVTGLTMLLIIFRFIFDGADGGSLDRRIGLFLAVVAAGIALAGSVIGFKDSGGDLNDLKDINKLKQQFGVTGTTDGGSPPPPPAPPPPPPPPAPPSDS
jgi:hypothetical protein